MNKQRREESEMKGRGKHREKKEHKKHMSHGGSAHSDIGLTGARSNNTNSYSGGAAVDKMMKGEHHTTNGETVKCHLAAGGAAKVRKGEY